MSKYVIDTTLDNVKKVIAMGVTKGGAIWTDTTDIENLEELSSDYINEHFGELQDTAYQRGLENGKQATFALVADASDAEYQRGLNDAWECARKIVCDDTCGGMSMKELVEIFNKSSDAYIIRDYTAQQAIEMLKAHEEKQKADEKIEVGDEVEWDNDFTGDRFIVTRIYQPYGKKEQCDGIDDDGDVYRAVLIESLVKTGRHFDIASILEAMSHD